MALYRHLQRQGWREIFSVVLLRLAIHGATLSIVRMRICYVTSYADAGVP